MDNFAKEILTNPLLGESTSLPRKEQQELENSLSEIAPNEANLIGGIMELENPEDWDRVNKKGSIVSRSSHYTIKIEEVNWNKEEGK